MSAYTIKLLEDKQARAYQAILASLPLEQRSDSKALTYSGYLPPTTLTAEYIAPRPCGTCAGLGVPCHITLRPYSQTSIRPAVPTKRMELAWKDDGEDNNTGSQMWIFFVGGICECCTVTDAFCSTANRVLAFCCLPRTGRTWSWCLVRATASRTGRARSKRLAARASAPCLALTGVNRTRR